MFAVGVLPRLVVRVHDVKGDYPHLRGVKGIGTYSDRACLLPGIVFILGPEDPDMRFWLEDLKRVGIGPDEVLWLDPTAGKEDGLYEAMFESRLALDAIDEVLRAGGRFEPFCSSDKTKGVIADLIGRLTNTPEFTPEREGHFHCPPTEMAKIWNDKSATRTALQEEGLAYVFPKFEICKTRVELRDAVVAFSTIGDYVVKLEPTAASTEGMHFFAKDTLPDTGLVDNWEEGKSEAIVERYISHVPFSMTWSLEDDVRFAFSSLQKLAGIKAGAVIPIERMQNKPPHCGNVVGACGQGIGSIDHELVAVADLYLRPVLDLVKERGYRGLINMDLALDLAKLQALRERGERLTVENIRGIVYMLEFNARTSNSRYTAGVQSATARYFEGGCNVVFMANVEGVDPMLTSYAAAKERLMKAGIFYEGTGPGVQLYHVRLLRQGVGKCGVLAIADSFEVAASLYEKVKLALQLKVYEEHKSLVA